MFNISIHVSYKINNSAFTSLNSECMHLWANSANQCLLRNKRLSCMFFESMLSSSFNIPTVELSKMLRMYSFRSFELFVKFDFDMLISSLLSLLLLSFELCISVFLPLYILELYFSNTEKKYANATKNSFKSLELK